MQILRSIGFAALLLLLAGCGGLSSEPAIVRTAALPTITPTPPPDIGHPTQRINLARGAEIFNGAQGCQNCHGTGGQGNGAVAANFTCKIPNATDPAAARDMSVAAWFAITTNGNGGETTCLMPPWKGRLNEQQRWDVTSYLYSLHYTPTMLDAGAKVWAQNCTACHGEQGAGDGPKAKDSSRPVPNFADPSYLISHSDTDLYNSVTHGIGAIMPAFDKTLSDDERWSVVAYARSFAWEGVDEARALVTATAPTAPTTPPVGILAPESPTFTVSGKVTNGTPDGKVPGDLALTLRILDVSAGTPRELGNFKTTISGDTFTFKDVPRQIGQVYVVTTQYGGIQQITPPLKLAAGTGPTLNLPLTIYEVSSDPNLIQIDVQQIFVEFPSSASAVIQQGMSFHNTGQRIYLSDQTLNGSRVSLQQPLPNDAQQISVDPNTQDQFTLSSTPPVIQSIQPVVPGESRTLQFQYTLPFAGQVSVTQPSLYTVQSLIIYTEEQSGYVIADKDYTPSKSITLKDNNNQDVVYRAYALSSPLPAGLPLKFTAASQAKLLSDDAVLRRNTLAVVLTLALIVFALIGFAVWRLNRGDRPTPFGADATERLIQQIAELDDRFEAGKVPQPDYEAQRAKLKGQLTQLMG